jgi:hypothetical protein
MNRTSHRLTAALALAWVTTTAPGAALPVEQAGARLAERMHYYTRDGGSWTSPNRAFVAGGRQPHTFTYDFSSILFDEAVHLEIGGILEDGTRVVYWEDMILFDPRREEVVIHQFGPNGAMLHGVERELRDGTREIQLTGHGISGESLELREVTRLVGPDEMHSTSYERKDGAWVAKDTDVWRRVEAAPAPRVAPGG